MTVASTDVYTLGFYSIVYNTSDQIKPLDRCDLWFWFVLCKSVWRTVAKVLRGLHSMQSGPLVVACALQVAMRTA
jgi:hypothetical protein